jgi:hypothetical protein
MRGRFLCHPAVNQQILFNHKRKFAMKTADNKKPPIRINSIVFAIFWALSYVIGAAAAYFLTFTLFEPPLQIVPWWYTFGLIITLITTMGVVSSSIQRFVMWLRFGRRLTGWRRTSIIGWWLGGLVFLAVSRLFAYLNIPDFDWFWLVVPQAIGMLTPLALIQWLVLRRQVDRAWLYVLASVSSATILATLIVGFREIINLLGMSLVLGAQALVMAYTLVWLFSMSGSVTPKQQVTPDTSRLTTPDAAEQDINSLLYTETPSALSEKLD